MMKQSQAESYVELARRIAKKAHAGQFRRGGKVQYIDHPEKVVGRVGNDPELQTVAWLHDVIEQSDETFETLAEAGIPAHLAEAVVLLTYDAGTSYSAYLDRIAESPIATSVKIADMLSNLADDPTVAQIRKYSKGLLQLTNTPGS